MLIDFPQSSGLLSHVSQSTGIESVASNLNNESPTIEFESVFFSLLIKNMRNSMTEEGLFGSDSSDTYGGLFDLYMGQHLAASNGLGIGQMIASYDQVNQSQIEQINSNKEVGTDAINQSLP